MSIEKKLEEIKVLLQNLSKKTSEINADVEILQDKLNTQNSRISNLSAKTDEIIQTNIESHTLLEEIAYSILEDENKNIIIEDKQDEKNIHLSKQKYLN